MRWITTTDLKQWANGREAQGILPLLVRKLIRSTVGGEIDKLKFPAGDSIHLGGWDGKLESRVETEFIPKGISYWEVGSGKNISTKANKDYSKRTKDPLGGDPSTSTFIFVTPRIWTNKNDWRKEKKKEGIWKEVYVYDAEDLEGWIELNPSVGAWFATHTGKFPRYIQSADDFWEEWSIGNEFNIEPDLLLSGRKDEAKEFKRWFESDPSALAIYSSSTIESIAFAVACAKEFPPNLMEDFFSRTVVVEEKQAFRQLVHNTNPLNLIVKFEDKSIVNNAVAKGHHVVIPLGPERQTGNFNSISIPILGREDFLNSIKEHGFTDEEARKISKQTGRNIEVFRRRFGFTLNIPEWAKQTKSSQLTGALLAGRWDESKKKDQEVFENIADESYSEYVKTLTEYLNIPDSPFYKIGSKWRLASPLDAWNNISNRITADELGRFKNATLDTLSVIDPTFALEPEKRYAASVHGIEYEYSSWIREGLAQSLVLISTFGDNFDLPISTTAKTWVDNIVRSLLADASGDLWKSLRDVLPLLAEAAPDTFLEMVENSLKDENQQILQMFDEFDSAFSTQSYHPNLLWALESLAWFPSHFSRATRILAKLAKSAPEVKLLNKPINSLREIFLVWKPQTYASLNTRFQVLESTSEGFPEVTWNLLMNLLPKNRRDIGHPTYKPRYRKPEEMEGESLTERDVWESYSKIMDIALKLADCKEKYIELFEHYNSLPVPDRKKVRESLREFINDSGLKSYSLWHQLMVILHRNRSHPDADWASSEEEIEEIETLFNQLQPEDSKLKYKHLFQEVYPKLPEGFNSKSVSHDEHQEKVYQLRKNAVQDIYDSLEFRDFLNYASEIKEARIFGEVSAEEIEDEDQAKEVLELLNSEDGNKLNFVQGFIWKKVRLNSFKWVREHYNKLEQAGFDTEVLALYLTSITHNEELWEFVENLENGIQNEFWLRCDTNFFDVKDEHIERGVRKLMSVGRYISSIRIASIHKEHLPSSLLLEILKDAATNKSEESKGLAQYQVLNIFEELESRNDYDKDKIPQLEWLYLPVISSYGRPSKELSLHEYLSKDPSFFIEVITLAYKEEDSNADEKLTEEQINKAHLAYDLLSGWNKIPGHENCTIDKNKLFSWVEETRKKAEEANRLKVTDLTIGKMLASYPRNDSQNWPPEPICELIESINTDEIKDGFYTAIKNSRGTVTKSPFQGGDQERELAQEFDNYSSNISTSYPITSSILKRVSDSYLNEAKREDERAEETKLDY
jgi:hypothetical protein